MAHTTKTVPGEVAWSSDLRLGEVIVLGVTRKPQWKGQSIAVWGREARFTEPVAIAPGSVTLHSQHEYRHRKLPRRVRPRLVQNAQSELIETALRLSYALDPT